MDISKIKSKKINEDNNSNTPKFSKTNEPIKNKISKNKYKLYSKRKTSSINKRK